MKWEFAKDGKFHIQTREAHDKILKDYVDQAWKDQDVEVDWEYSGPGVYRIHEHTTGLIPCVSLKWEGV